VGGRPHIGARAKAKNLHFVGDLAMVCKTERDKTGIDDRRRAIRVVDGLYFRIVKARRATSAE
jgi:hypothetical protein